MSIQEFIAKISAQNAVYWEHTGKDAYGGDTFKTPVDIPCRWDDTVELITASDGEQIASRAKVLTPHDLAEQGFLYLGTVASLSPEQKADPKLVDTAYPIRRWEKIPLIKKTDEFVRTAYL